MHGGLHGHCRPAGRVKRQNCQISRGNALGLGGELGEKGAAATNLAVTASETLLPRIWQCPTCVNIALSAGLGQQMILGPGGLGLNFPARSAHGCNQPFSTRNVSLSACLTLAQTQQSITCLLAPVFAAASATSFLPMSTMLTPMGCPSFDSLVHDRVGPVLQQLWVKRVEIIKHWRFIFLESICGLCWRAA